MRFITAGASPRPTFLLFADYDIVCFVEGALYKRIDVEAGFFLDYLLHLWLCYRVLWCKDCAAVFVWEDGSFKCALVVQVVH